MTLYLIGLGLYDEKDITIRGLETVKKCEYVYLESYTSMLSAPVKTLEKLYRKKIILADRELVEQKAEEILEKAAKSNVAFLVAGDVFSATTHTDLVLRAKEREIKVEVVHNASILNAVGVTGLELYKFGKTTSITFQEEGFKPSTPYDVIKQNQSLGLHTLCLLDIKVKEESKEGLRQGKKDYLPPRFLTVNQAISILLDFEKEKKEGVFKETTLVVGCARIGSPLQKIAYGTAKELLAVDFGGPLHCLIVTGNLHFVEEEAVETYRVF